jgi:hypothetical protein
VPLPIADEPVTVTISDKVYVSLRTKNARDAKKRFQAAPRGSVSGVADDHWLRAPV